MEREEIQVDKLDKIELQSLKNLAFYLEGIRHAKGSLDPLGDITLRALWAAYRRLVIQQNLSRTTNETLFKALEEASDKLHEHGDQFAHHLDKVKSDYESRLPF